MGVNITSSSRAELEFEECPYCHSDSAAKYEYITAATGAWVVVKYTCLKCASQFIYDCRELRPNPILVQGAREDWPYKYTTESEMWRDRLGYKKIEKPKEESMVRTDDAMSNYEKFQQPVGSVVEFEGESYVVCSDESSLVTCGSCDLLGVCSINNWPMLCEEGKYYKKAEAADMKLVKDVRKFNGEDFDEKVKASNNVSDKNDQLNMSKVVYNSVLDFKNVFALPIGSVFRKGYRLIRVVESSNPGHCSDCGLCALSHECAKRGEDGYRCPDTRWYKDIGCAYTYAPCCCKEDGLAATINAKEGSTDGITSRSIVADLKMNCDVLTLDAAQLDAIIDNSRVFCKYCGKTYGTVKQHVASINTSNNFLDDGDKLVDFFKLTKEEFLKSYSYLTEEEYEATKDAINKKMSK